MSVEVVPVVIGHTGMVTSYSKQLLNKIPGFCTSLFNQQPLSEQFTF